MRCGCWTQLRNSAEFTAGWAERWQKVNLAKCRGVTLSRWMWAGFISTNLISLKWKTWLPEGPERAEPENVGSTSLTKLHIVIWAAENSESTQLLKYAYAPVLMHKLDQFIKDHWNVSSLKHDQHYKHFSLFAWIRKVDKSKKALIERAFLTTIRLNVQHHFTL